MHSTTEESFFTKIEQRIEGESNYDAILERRVLCNRDRLKSFEMWTWSSMENISWKDHKITWAILT